MHNCCWERQDQMDILVYDRYELHKYKYILVVIDVYSRYVGAKSMTNRSLDTVMFNFDKIIDELEPGSLRLPVLIKKYIKQNARVVAFNVDPLFNNAVDGLMYIRVEDIPDSTMKPVMEEFQAELERKLSEKEE